MLEGGSNDLAKHCDKEKVDYMPFVSFTEVWKKAVYCAWREMPQETLADY